jgi:uncharacterized protein YchJ
MKNKLAVLVLLPIILFAGTITRTLNFSEQDLNYQQINEYNLVSLKGTIPYQIPGEPIVPMAVYNVLAPATAVVSEIKVVSEKEYTIPGKFYLYPGQEPRPISYTGNIPFTNTHPTIYNSSEVYPVKLVDWAGTGTKSGYRVAGFAVFPLRYIPSEQKLMLVTNLTLEIKYDEGKVPSEIITEKQENVFAPDVQNIVMNPEDVNRFAPMVSTAKDSEIDCAIITSDGLSSYFQPLVEWHNQKGFRTEIKTTSAISNNYTGRDMQEKIRNFIIDYYNNRGLKWVILGGDNSVIPAREARAVVGTYTGNIPADLYYGDLQWSWDGNHNNIFGEAGYDTVDFYADVYVGRASVENGNEVNAFVNKIFTFERNPNTAYLKRILLPSVWLWSSNNYHGHIANDTIAAISPAGWTDRSMLDPYSTSPMRDSINNGFEFVHPNAHGDELGMYSETGTQIYSISAAQSQTNSTKLNVMNSIACYCGNFEYSDCIAEAIMNNASGGSVAVIMNSRYGWGTPPTIGPSELLDIRFYDYFFNHDSSVIGSCHFGSKDYYSYSAQTQQVYRWCVFELNLFGDPLMPMWSDVPSAVDVSHAPSIQTGPQNLMIQVSRMGFPVTNALVGIYKSGEVYARGRTDGSGQATILVNAHTTGMMYVTVTGENSLPKQDSITVLQGSAVPYITLNSVSLSQINPNENDDINIGIRNSGTADATNTLGILRTSSSYITITDSTTNYGTVIAGAIGNGDQLSFIVSASAPTGIQIPFTLYVTSDQGNWNCNFNLQCGIPQQPGQVMINQDTGYCKLSVTALGSIGYIDPATKTGSGFCYPKSAISALYFSSMLAGNSAGYLVDRYYGQPASSLNHDWQIVDSLRFVRPPAYGDQQLRCSYNDAGHPSPRGLKVTQNSYMLSDSRYDDFVILVYDYLNTSAMPISGLYSGIISDFDVKPESSNTDIARSDVSRRLVYMHRAVTQNPTVGVKLLFPNLASSLVAIDHDRYVYPDSAMTESMKFRILNGTLGMPQSNRTYDWSVAAATGPIDLAPSQTTRVAFAYVGGASEAEFLANADSAQSWFDRMSLAGLAEENDGKIPHPSPRLDFKLSPNPSNMSLHITYNLINPGYMKLGLYDVSGQIRGEIFNGLVNNKIGVINYQIKDLPNGIYFVKLATDNNTVTKKLLLVK